MIIWIKQLIYLVGGLLLIAVPHAFAHQSSTAYLNVSMNNAGFLKGNIQLRAIDIHDLVQVDNNIDGNITWGEILANGQVIRASLEKRLRFMKKESVCSMIFDGELMLESHFNESYVVVPIHTQCPLSGNLSVHYDGVFEQNPTHKLIINTSFEKGTISQVLDENSRVAQLNLSNTTKLSAFLSFIKQGVIHIAIGYDHIVFVLCLLIASIFNPRKEPDSKASIKKTLTDTLVLITSFTLAHSLTLALVALDWIQVPSKWVEVGIATSIIVMAINNIFPIIQRVFWLTFGFGLLHGMGFAGVLGELGLPSDQKIMSVIAFNIGVELGQVLIIAVVLPIFLWLRQYSITPRRWAVSASTVIVFISAYWIVERVVNTV